MKQAYQNGARESTMARSFVIAWHFLTAVPFVRQSRAPDSHEWARSMAWFPLVGLALGSILAGAAMALSPVFPRHVTDALLVVLLVVLTRGLHQDGLADTLDGWLGGRSPEQRLLIMRDSRIGAFGATGLILTLGLRYVGLSALPDVARLSILACLPAIGRWAMVVGAVHVPYARAEGGLGQPFLQHLTGRDVLLATLLLFVPLMLAVGPLRGVVLTIVVACIARTVVMLARRLCGGITGDMLGLINECAELGFLLLVPVGMRM
jgi:adenosylcobinamide-GDP ribazoletransferase